MNRMVALLTGVILFLTQGPTGLLAGKVTTGSAVVTLTRQGQQTKTLAKNSTVTLFHGDTLSVKSGTATVVYNNDKTTSLSSSSGPTTIRRQWTSVETKIMNGYGSGYKAAVRQKGTNGDPGFPNMRLIPSFLFAYVPVAQLSGPQKLRVKKDGYERFSVTVSGDGWYSSKELHESLRQLEGDDRIIVSIGDCSFTLPSMAEEDEFSKTWNGWTKFPAPICDLGQASELLKADLPEFALFEIHRANQTAPVYPWAVDEERRLVKAGVHPIRFISTY